MKLILRLVLMGLIPLLAMASEIKEGTLSVLVFSNGKPLVSNEIRVDGQKSYQTDKDGSVKTPLRVGNHQIEIFGKGSSGENLGYFKKSITIQEGRDTEVIATLQKEGADSIDIDTPVAVKQMMQQDKQAATGEGKLMGTVLSSEGNLPIAGARVFVRGTSVDVRTDESGRFSATVPSGKSLSISVVHSAYSAQTVGGITVAKDGTASRVIKLTPASMELEEFVVLAPKIKGSLSEMMQEEKKSSAVTNILGSEEMSKKGDGDAASALKRVTGVTLVGGSSIYVRGLGDRYSNVEMNGMPLPSPDPTRRVVPLDIFPSGVISSMKVQKSGTADVPANFGGGYVDIRTKESASEDYIQVSLGVKGNRDTGKERIDYQGSDSDWSGFDDGYRDINSEILSETEIAVGKTPVSFDTRNYFKEELSRFMQNYVGDRTYAIENKSLPIGGSVGIEGAKHYALDEENVFSVFGSYGYSQDHTYVEEELAKYAVDLATPQVDASGNESYRALNTLPSNLGIAQRSQSEYAHSGILNIGYNFSDVFDIKYTKLYTHTGLKGTKMTIGEFGSNQNEVYHYADLEWEERTLQADQISGTLDYELFNKKSEFGFGYEVATAELSQPNNFRYIYIDDGGDIDPYLQKTSNQFAKKLASEDEVEAFYLKDRLYLDMLSSDDYVEIGYSNNDKIRSSHLNSLGIKINGDETEFTDSIDTIYDTYVRPDIWYNDRRFILENYTQAKNYFDAVVEESSWYSTLFMKPTDKIEVQMGVRLVNVSQNTTTYYLYNQREFHEEVYDAAKQNTYQTYDHLLALDNEFFPSASIKYKFDEKNSVDVAYAKTFILPDLREASSGIYTHPYEIADIQGNPDLNHTIIESYDIKYSHYFSGTESIKIGGFYKTLDQPIEDTQLPTSSLPIYSFQNSQSAKMYGIELDGRKSLSFIDDIVKDLYLSGNFTYADSEVTVNPAQELILSTNHRQLQGLSQIVVNVALSYETSTRNVTLAYNKMGERIRKLGMIEDGNVYYPDYMENPAALLDLVWIEKFSNGLNLKLKLGNLLDGETVWYQQDEAHATKRFKMGRNVGFSASYKY